MFVVTTPAALSTDTAIMAIRNNAKIDALLRLSLFSMVYLFTLYAGTTCHIVIP
jgi:hypothetical protein